MLWGVLLFEGYAGYRPEMRCRVNYGWLPAAINMKLADYRASGLR
ncbi:hypothetical protein CGRA01v4_03998 [Colletotrichum graminicola]|nr:hypothetical protein CGRA01v4_03998 [Colletotrichum graminicola]